MVHVISWCTLSHCNSGIIVVCSCKQHTKKSYHNFKEYSLILQCMDTDIMLYVLQEYSFRIKLVYDDNIKKYCVTYCMLYGHNVIPYDGNLYYLLPLEICNKTRLRSRENSSLPFSELGHSKATFECDCFYLIKIKSMKPYHIRSGPCT